MKSLSYIILVFTCLSFRLNGQSIDELLIPDKEVIKNSRLTIKNSLLQLKDSLDLSKSEMWIRKFELTPCNNKLELSLKYGKMIEQFVGPRDSCYFYQHRTNYHGSHNTVDFILDLNGNLIQKRVDFILVVH